MNQQLPLGIGLRDDATFDNFLQIGNEHVVAALRQVTDPSVYLWGNEGTGKSHLLQAICHFAAARQQRAAFLPLGEPGLMPAMLEGMEQYDWVCLDDIDRIAGVPEWETALFHAYNRIALAGHHLIVTAAVSPTALSVQLPDLQSRLGWGPVFQLQPLTDQAKCRALQQRAQNRGVMLEDDVAEYLMKRCPRDMTSLFHLLDGLDEASLAAKRRLTIPFVRDYLASQSLP